MQNHRRIRPKRTTTLLVLAAVLLAYVALFQHQIAHQLIGDNVHCAQCLAADHFGHAPIADVLVLPVVRHHEYLQSFFVVRLDETQAVYFSARAPPVVSLV